MCLPLYLFATLLALAPPDTSPAAEPSWEAPAVAMNRPSPASGAYPGRPHRRPAPAWQRDFDWGIRALEEGDPAGAIRLLERAERRLSPRDDPDGLVEAELLILLGDAHGLWAQRAPSRAMRRDLLDDAGHCYHLARTLLDPQVPGATALYCDATERLADVRWTFATESGGPGGLLSHIGSLSSSRRTVAELYLESLRHREIAFGENHPEVMAFRRTVVRRLDALIARLAEYTDIADPDLRTECHRLDRHYGVLVELLAERDEALASAAPAATAEAEMAEAADPSSDGSPPAGSASAMRPARP